MKAPPGYQLVNAKAYGEGCDCSSSASCGGDCGGKCGGGCGCGGGAKKRRVTPQEAKNLGTQLGISFPDDHTSGPMWDRPDGLGARSSGRRQTVPRRTDRAISRRVPSRGVRGSLVDSKPNFMRQTNAPTFPNYYGEIMAPGLYEANGGGNPLAPMGSFGGGPTTGTPSWCRGFTCKVRGIPVTGVKDPNRNAVCHGWDCEVCEDCDETSPGLPDLGEVCPEWCLMFYTAYMKKCGARPQGSSQHKSDCKQFAIDYVRNCIHSGWPCPPVAITPYLPTCGPDVTEWLMDKLIANARWIEKERPNVYVFQAMLRGIWNYNATPYKSRDNACPTPECGHTVTLCGMCLSDSVPEDINFGVVANRSGYHPEFAGRAANWVSWLSKGQNDSPGAHEAFAVGYSIDKEGFRDRDGFCKKLKGKALNKGPKGCLPCKRKFGYKV